VKGVGEGGGGGGGGGDGCSGGGGVGGGEGGGGEGGGDVTVRLCPLDFFFVNITLNYEMQVKWQYAEAQ
jgi:hypothetical protein